MLTFFVFILSVTSLGCGVDANVELVFEALFQRFIVYQRGLVNAVMPIKKLFYRKVVCSDVCIRKERMVCST